MEYFLETYIKIITLDGGLEDFHPYKYQSKIAKTVQHNRFVIIRQPRQSGKTTCVAAIILWHVLFKSEYTVAICANKAKNAAGVLARIKLAYEYLPKWMQQGITTWNKGDIELENHSRILTYATSADACRSESINMLYLDELAFVAKNIQVEFFESVYPTISSGATTKILITSTPKGLEMFYKLWTEAVGKKNTYVPIDVHWSEVPGRDEKWKEETIKNIGQQSFDQEFGCDFIGSSDTLIAASALKRIPFIDPVRNISDLKIYKEPLEEHSYCCIVDTSRGVGLDYSAFVIIDITAPPYEVAATYRNNMIAPIQYPLVIHSALKLYNEALVLVEINDIGEQVASILWDDLEYEGLIMTTLRGAKGVVMGGGYGKNSRYGVRTTTQVKALGCSNLKGLLEHEKLITNDINILDELTTFVAVRNSYEASTGNHDDLVMCLVLFSWMTDQQYFKEMTDSDMRSLIYKQNEERAEEEVMDFVLDDGHDEGMKEFDMGCFSPLYDESFWT